LRIYALDTQISATYEPVNPSRTFQAGFTRLFFFVEFRSMERGVLWRRELIRDGVVIQQGQFLWGQDSTGRTFFFVGEESGFTAGQYELRLYIGESQSPEVTTPFVVE
jgi:hypothetical protein